MPTVINRNPDEISMANFTVLSGANALAREPSGGGEAGKNGALKGGKTIMTNATNDTSVPGGRYFISTDNEEDI